MCCPEEAMVPIEIVVWGSDQITPKKKATPCGSDPSEVSIPFHLLRTYPSPYDFRANSFIHFVPPRALNVFPFPSRPVLCITLKTKKPNR
ncbi:hypothetical protein HMPREF1015_01886 [Bacillus smithii 7_3_47FAA]|uniref:Uncharacterized protein n=1 Tax=Bacillus smithii 7_3_47FAA TaxID=665952 RepID=G9QJK3_9BACI|nr:hypothetical protein HMPREF1015_01886 [Bacillus smithii 7_3_47FAA]